MKSSKFVGRKAELARLKKLLDKTSASLVVVRGRRRIGKSRLLSEFGKEMKSFFFSGLPPTPETTAQSQRTEFAHQLERAGLPGIKPDDWGNMLWHLSNLTKEGLALIVLDEVSWMGSKDPDFLGKLKNAWDMYFSKNPKLILVLCGSISSWIEENILGSTGFVGRVTIDLVIEELPANVCNAFWSPREKRISSYEKFKLLSVTGGVPLYLEQINPAISAEQNILDLCFTQGGLLVREFDDIFSDLFSRTSQSHKALVSQIVDRAKPSSLICKELEIGAGGYYRRQLDELAKAGFIQRDFTWKLDRAQEGKLSHYRLRDNYLRFYLKYISPHRHKIDRGDYVGAMPSRLAGWTSVMGLQFENLVVHNRHLVWSLLGIRPEDIVMDGPFFQTRTARQAGCQIDYMIQTQFNTLYICEVKFTKDPIKAAVIQELEAKKQRLKTPKGFSIRPVLIHVNGVEERVADEHYFDSVIDFGDLLV